MAFALLAAFFISAQTLGQAQSESNEVRNLMKQAQAAKAAGDHAQALTLASRAGEIRMTPAVRLFIAEEQKEVGDIIGAMSNAEACAHEAAASKLPDRNTIVKSCRGLLGRLQQFAARLVVTLVNPPPLTVISICGGGLTRVTTRRAANCCSLPSNPLHDLTIVFRSGSLDAAAS